MSDNREELSIEIELENFNYEDVYNDDERENSFFGRKKEILNLTNILSNQQKSGCFLVSGYRGAGKTRFVNKVISEYIEPKKKLVNIDINIPRFNKTTNKLINITISITIKIILRILRILKILLSFILIVPKMLGRIFLNKYSFSTRGIMIVDVRVNLGNDSDLNARDVLSSMVLLLRDRVEEKINFQTKISAWLVKNPSARKKHKTIELFSTYLVRACLAIIFCTPIILFAIEKPPFLFYTEFKEHFSALLLILTSLFFSVIMFYKIFPFYSRETDLIDKLESLMQKIDSSTSEEYKIGSKGTGINRKLSFNPLRSNSIESKLINIIKESYRNGIRILFVFDELDKLSGPLYNSSVEHVGMIQEIKARKKQVDILLGDLKNFITSSDARYIFIAGRDMYDAYLSETGSTNSLYESLFSYCIYIPSLLTDGSDKQVYLLDSMIEAYVSSKLHKENKEDKDYPNLKKYNNHLENLDEKYIKKMQDDLKKESDPKESKLKQEQYESAPQERKLRREQYIFTLKIFIHFLALHSWGNCKRLITQFTSFVIKKEIDGKETYFIKFTTQDMQRLILASHSYILFHHNLSRMLMNADDKLVVSSLSIFNYIMKFHGMGFSRGHISRMYESINVHSSPELVRVIDVIVHNVLKNHIRRIRNSFYRYRFSSLYEQEIHFITTISDNDSAAFNFSLDEMDTVKRHYQNLLQEYQTDGTPSSAKVPIYVIIGNYHFWERSFDEANVNYNIAGELLEKHWNDELARAKERGKNASIPANLIIQLVEIFLKRASVAERLGNYSMAAALYQDAKDISEQRFLVPAEIDQSDSKWDILWQPAWALRFLNLKRSAIHYTAKNFESSGGAEDVSAYRNGVLALFMGRYQNSINYFKLSVNKKQSACILGERQAYLEGNASLKSGFSLLMNKSDLLCEEMGSLEGKTEEKLIQSIGLVAKQLSTSINGLSNLSLKQLEDRGREYIRSNNIDISTTCDSITDAIGLMAWSAKLFSEGKLDSNSASSYLSTVMSWEVFLEMLPWNKIKELKIDGILDNKTSNNISSIISDIKQMRKSSNSWVCEAQELAFTATSYNTNKALSHFMKTALRRNLNLNYKDTLFSKHSKARDIIFDEEFLQTLLYQHYSMFGQMVVASIYWEDVTEAHIIDAEAHTGNAEKPKSDVLINDNVNLLPYSVRYYSIMLWLRGKTRLKELYSLCDSDENKFIKAKEIAIKSIVDLFRASQYVTKTRGDTSGMLLPPIFLIYYNLWENIYYLVSTFGKEKPYSEKVSWIHSELDHELEDHYKDVSSRILDLEYLEQTAIEQLKIVQSMGDPNSRDRTSVLKNKYYLDDDYEDSIFTLDWSYCRIFSPGALIHQLTIERDMEKLRNTEPQSR